jgi:hypothetical protein
MASTKTQSDHIVLISGGLASFEVARRVLSRHQRSHVRLWFFDTLIEDEDLYRFLDDIERFLGIPIQRFMDGRTPWDIFADERFIGNSRADLCSKHLKRLLLEKEIKRHYQGLSKPVLYFGLDWSEEHRVRALKPHWEKKGYKVEFPLLEPPFLMRDDYISVVESLGIRPPRLYSLGFTHNNCGGACVKAGISQWARLLDVFPERYLWHERMEQKIRKYLRKDVSILRNRIGGRTRPMTLRYLRWRIGQRNGSSPSPEVIADSEIDVSCSCFVNMLELGDPAAEEN